MRTSANGSLVRRVDKTIFIKLPRGQWTEIQGGCVCPSCKAVPGRKAYWDTLAVAARGPETRGVGDYAWTVHQPDAHPEAMTGDEIDREGNRASKAA